MTMEQWREELYHSSGPWKKHKYIKIQNGHYVYPQTRGGSLDILTNLAEQQKKDNEQATANYRRRKLEQAAKEDSYYKKAPKGILNKIGWALGRLNNGIPVNSKEYQVYFRNGKKYVEAVQDKPTGSLGSVLGAKRSNIPVSRKKNVSSGGSGVSKRGKANTRARY